MVCTLTGNESTPNFRRTTPKIQRQFHWKKPGLLFRRKDEQEPSGRKASKSSKKEVDAGLPPAPKRQLSSYLHFCAAKRPDVAGSVKSLGEVSKKLASLWAETSPDDRREYEEMAASGKIEYLKKKEVWEKECQKLTGKTQSEKKGSAKKARLTTDLVAAPPKRPRSSYILFCSAKRPEVSKTLKSLGDISKELGRQWAETKDRTEFENLAAADVQRYEREMEKHSGTSNGQGAGKPSRTRHLLCQPQGPLLRTCSSVESFARQWWTTLVRNFPSERRQNGWLPSGENATWKLSPDFNSLPQKRKIRLSPLCSLDSLSI